MVIVEKSLIYIRGFIENSIEQFITTHGHPSIVGIYCCPWSGWLTINFNKEKSLEESHHNCPDFQYVEFDTLPLPDWQTEYEKDKPEFEINGRIVQHHHQLGDENLNELIYIHLKPLVNTIKDKYQCLLLLQMLDSRFVEVI
jgi:hypothetical protein